MLADKDSEIAALKAQVQEAKEYADSDYCPKCAELRSENVRYREALEFYASEYSWTGLVHVEVGLWEGWDGTLMAHDNGKRARAALAECNNGTQKPDVGANIQLSSKGEK